MSDCIYQGEQVKETIKQILVRSLGLVMATAFGGTAIGAVAGDVWMGALVGVGSAFAVVATTLGVAIAWRGTLELQDISNAFRAAVAKSDSEAVEDALKVTQDGKFDFDDVVYDGDDDLYESDATDDVK
jgi:flagellar motor component MotA